MENQEAQSDCQQEASYTARFTGDGYDVQVCTSEPLTGEEKEAMHEFLRSLTLARKDSK